MSIGRRRSRARVHSAKALLIAHFPSLKTTEPTNDRVDGKLPRPELLFIWMANRNKPESFKHKKTTRGRGFILSYDKLISNITYQSSSQ